MSRSKLVGDPIADGDESQALVTFVKGIDRAFWFHSYRGFVRAVPLLSESRQLRRHEELKQLEYGWPALGSDAYWFRVQASLAMGSLTIAVALLFIGIAVGSIPQLSWAFGVAILLIPIPIGLFVPVSLRYGDARRQAGITASPLLNRGLRDASGPDRKIVPTPRHLKEGSRDLLIAFGMFAFIELFLVPTVILVAR